MKNTIYIYIYIDLYNSTVQSGEKEGLKKVKVTLKIDDTLLNPSKSDVIKGKMLAISCVVSFLRYAQVVQVCNFVTTPFNTLLFEADFTPESNISTAYFNETTFFAFYFHPFCISF